MNYLDGIAPKNFAAECAVNIALLDGAARRAGKPIYDHLGLGFTENKHVTSFSIGIDKPEAIRKKVLEADPYPVLKLKVGGPDDQQNLVALREAAPKKPVRVDANEAWKTMIGCMIESSVLITAGAHLAELADYLDIDGNLLITNDPNLGATAEKGVISFARTPGKIGLRVTAKQ